MTRPGDGGARGSAAGGGAPVPFIEGEVVTLRLAAEVIKVWPVSEENPEGLLRVRVDRHWGGSRYWDCTPAELRAATGS